MRLIVIGLIVAMLAGLFGCDDGVRPGDDSGPDTDTDTDTDSDTDTDTDTDSDADTDTGYLPMTDCEGGKYDPNSGLCWQFPYSEQQYLWADAVAYCEGLVVGESEDWRMPTVTELRSLVRGCPATEPEGSCPISENSPQDDETDDCDGCDEHMGPGGGGCYWDEALENDCDVVFWSYSEVADMDDYIWAIGYDWSLILTWSINQTDYVRCVRDGQ